MGKISKASGWVHVFDDESLTRALSELSTITDFIHYLKSRVALFETAIRTGLRGRVVRARNMAINALQDWGRDAWPLDAMEELRLAAEREPDKKVRQRMRDLIDRELRH